MKLSLLSKTIKFLTPIAIVSSLTPMFYTSCSKLKPTCLCFSAISDNTNLFCLRTNQFDISKLPNLYYSKDNRNWHKLDIIDETSALRPSFVTLNKNECVFIKGGNPNGLSYGENEYIHFTATDNDDNYIEFNSSGDIMSLIDNGTHTKAIPNNYCFYRMFGLTDYSECHLVTPPLLPATEITEFCYSYMFYDDQWLVSAPELPSTTVKNKCYAYMFSQCTSLKASPALKATTGAPYCYDHMFYGNASNEFIELHITDWDREGNFPCCFWVSFDGTYRMSEKGTFRCPKALIPDISDPNNFSETRVPYHWTIETF